MVEQVKREKADVIARIREAIGVYGISPKELFWKGGTPKKPEKPVTSIVKAVPKARPGKRREFSFEQKLELLDMHNKHMLEGKSHWAASHLIDVTDNLVKTWRQKYDRPVPQREQRQA